MNINKLIRDFKRKELLQKKQVQKRARFRNFLTPRIIKRLQKSHPNLVKNKAIYIVGKSIGFCCDPNNLSRFEREAKEICTELFIVSNHTVYHYKNKLSFSYYSCKHITSVNDTTTKLILIRNN